jgi:hypothetical protein
VRGLEGAGRDGYGISTSLGAGKVEVAIRVKGNRPASDSAQTKDERRARGVELGEETGVPANLGDHGVRRRWELSADALAAHDGLPFGADRDIGG